MALEQAEQQFVAASTVGVQTSPLNLFYGLSQAGRAVSAALTTPKDEYRLRGHGITNPGLDNTGVASFLSLTVQRIGGDQTSFGHVSRLLRSAPLGQPLALGRLLRMLVELEMYEPFDAEGLPVRIAEGRKHNQDMLLVNVSPVEPEFTAEDFHQMAREYPSLAGMTVSRVNEVYTDHRGRERLSIELLHLESNDPASIGVDYRGSRVALPAVDENGRMLHPMMVWWAVLYTLSMLARYHPAAWTAITDVDKSRHAVPLEYLLHVAQDSVPDILWRTISEA